MLRANGTDPVLKCRMNILTPKLRKRKVYYESFSSGQQQQQQQDQQQQQQQQDPAGKKCLRSHIYDDST